MNRTQSLILAGFFAALITAGVVTFGNFVASAANQPAPVENQPVGVESVGMSSQNAEIVADFAAM